MIELDRLLAFNWIDRLPQPIRAKLVARMSVKQFSEGAFVWRPGDTGGDLYQVVTGKVKYFTNTADGKELLYITFSSGDCFGENSMIGNERRHHPAQTVGDSELRVLKAQDYKELAKEHDEIHWALMESLVKKIRILTEYIDATTLLPIPVRIAIRLCLLIDMEKGQYPRPKQNIVLAATQLDIASMVGTSRQTVSKVMAEWQHQGVLTIHYGHIDIHQPNFLKALKATS